MSQDPENKITWLKSIGLHTGNLTNKHNFVCEIHFVPKRIGYSRLTRNTVPCLNMPSLDDEPPENTINICRFELNSQKNKALESIGMQTDPVDDETEFLKLINQVNCSHCDANNYLLKYECHGCSKKSIQINVYKKNLQFSKII